MIYVTKFDGSKQPFEKQKIMQTCLRMRASYDAAKAIADRIEAGAYDGITTKKIMQLIFTYLRKYRPEVRHIIDLRTAISALRPKPDFELFVAQLLRAYGYKVESNIMIAGKCVEHEIDAIAEKDDDVLYIEIKHHYNAHTFTGVDVFLGARATFEDMVEGYKIGSNKTKFNKAMVVSNTKLSDHAKRYADCRGIMYIGWKAPIERGLEQMIEEKHMHPITFLRGLDSEDEAKLGDAGIVTLKQLLDMDIYELCEKTGVPKKTLEELMLKAQKVLSV